MSLIVRGIPQTRAALAKIEIQIKAAASQAARAGGEVVGRNMIARAPRDTGRLVSEIGVDVDGETARVGSDAPYDRFVQRGTRYMAAQQYGQDAADASHSGIIAAQLAVYKAAVT